MLRRFAVDGAPGRGSDITDIASDSSAAEVISVSVPVCLAERDFCLIFVSKRSLPVVGSLPPDVASSSGGTSGG